MHSSEIKARVAIKSKTNAMLIDCFEATESQTISLDSATVRGWIMDELESRDAKAYDAWIMSDTASPRGYFTTN